MKINIDDMRLHFVVIAIAVLALFGGSLSYDFVWDDNVLTVGNEVYENFDLGGMFFSLGNRLEYLPVRDISYALDYLIWGWSPIGFHLSNIVFYLLNALFLYVMTLEITALLFPDKDERCLKGVAFVTTMLFVVHPIHSEVVNFVSCRNVLLAAMFFFLSCFFYLRFMKVESGGKYYAAALLCFVLSLFSKATSIILPVVLLMFVAFGGKGMRKALALIPFFIISGAVFFLFKSVAAKAGFMNEGQFLIFGASSWISRVAVAAQIPFFYLKKLAVPQGFSALYPEDFSRILLDTDVILSLLALSAAFGIGLALRRKYPAVLFSQCWFMITLVPALNLFRATSAVADRYAYISSYAFVYFFAVVLLLGSHEVLRRWSLILLVPAIGVLSFVSYERNGDWKSEKTLWEAAVKAAPEATGALSKLGGVYIREEDYDKAFSVFEKLKELRPIDKSLEYHKGVLSLRRGDLSNAIAYFEEVIAAEGGNINVNYMLGMVYKTTGNYGKAIESFMNVMRSGSLDATGKKDLAREQLNILRAKISSRWVSLRKEVLKDPADLNAKASLALALDSAGMYDEALDLYAELIRLGGDKWNVYYNMANIYDKTGRGEEAVIYYDKSLLLNKNNPNIYNNLGILNRGLGKFDASIDAFKKAISIDRNYGYAYFNLATTYFQLGDSENALRYFRLVAKSFPELKDKTYEYMRQLED